MGQDFFAGGFQGGNIIFKRIPYRGNVDRTVSVNIEVSCVLDDAPWNRLIQTVSAQGCWLMYAQQLIQLLDALLFCRCRFFQRADFILHTAVINILVMTSQKLRLKAPTDILEPKEGEILKIDRSGRITTGAFAPRTSYEHWWRRYSPYYRDFCVDAHVNYDD